MNDVTIDGDSTRLLAVGTPELWTAIGSLVDRLRPERPTEGLALTGIDLAQFN